jgi:hypothetical protein
MGGGVAYNGSDLWVAVGYSVPIKRSLDGITWNDASSVLTGFAPGSGVAYDGIGVWIAVGGTNTSNSIVTSTDGDSWSFPAGLNAFPDRGHDVAYGGGKWIAVGGDSSGGKTIKYSINSGATWLDVTYGAFSTSGNGIAYGDGLWVAVGEDSDGSTIKWSYDGLIWNNYISNAFSIVGIKIAYNNGLWIAVGDDATATIKGSLDGQYWIDSLPGTNVKYSVAYGDGRWIVGGFNTIIYSDNSGTSWNAMTNAFSSIAYGSAYGDGKWVAVGNDSAGKTIKVIECPASIPPSAPLVTDVAVGDGDTILVSYNNGVNWTHTGISGEFTLTGIGVGYGLVRGFPGWVATGVSNGVPKLAYSNDGLNWTFGTGTTFDYSANSVVFNGDGWLALGSGANKILKSADGIDWSPITDPTNVFSASGNQAAWDGTKWIAVGQGTNTMITTIDATGDTGWTAVPSGLFTTKGNGIAFNGSRWIAVGDGGGFNMKTSIDGGTTWTDSGISGFFTTEGKQVAFNGYYWIAVGTATLPGAFNIFKSTDGTTWTAKPNPQTNTYTITWNGLYWIAGGDGTATSTIAISQDGEIWTSASGTLFADVALGVCPRKTLPAPPLAPP